MGDEHDSWLEGIGVTWFKSSDATDSVASGAGDMLKSGLKAVGDVADAGWDGAAAAGGAILGGAAQIDAGILDAVGAHNAAGEIRDGANVMQDDASRYAGDAGRDLGRAKEDVFGVDPILPPPPPPGTPPMPPIPPPPPLPKDLPPTDMDQPEEE